MPENEDDLWFLPAPPEDMAPTDLPWPMAPQRPRIDPADWQAAERPQARALADTAETVGRLRERLAHMPYGVQHRLDLTEVCALMTLDGQRISPERLALYRAGRLATGDDFPQLSEANWALRRLTSRAGPLEDPAAFFDRRGSDLFGDWQDRQSTMSAHPLTQGGFACRALWSEIFEQDRILSPAIAARRLMPLGARLTLAHRQELIGGDLGDWLNAVRRSCDAALMELDRLAQWNRRINQQPLSRTTKGLIPTLLKHPAVSIPLIVAEANASRASAGRGVEQLEDLGFIREMTGQKRYRFWTLIA